MSDLITKNVPFYGAELLAVQDKTTGKIYAGINSVLRELGFDEKQTEYRRDKWKNDKILNKGTLKFSGTLLGLPTGKDTWCIDIKKLPIALAKIEITPKMEKELPELSDKLEHYQECCADVLAEAFLSKEKMMIIPEDFPSALRAYADEKRMLLEQKNEILTEENAEMKPKAEYHDEVLNKDGLITTTVIAKDLGFKSAAKLNQILNLNHILFKNQSGTWCPYAEYEWLITENYADYQSYGAEKAKPCLKWTERGRKWITENYNKWVQNLIK